MSQEQQPIRSRRELRRARGERLEHNEPVPGQSAGNALAGHGPKRPEGSRKQPEGAVTPDGGAGTPRVRRVADVPVDAVSESSSSVRSSQIRARDRAALRAIKELADKEEQLAGGGPPTRRQLRLQQLAEEVAPSTSMIPVVDGGGVRASSGPPPAKAPSAALPETLDPEPWHPEPRDPETRRPDAAAPGVQAAPAGMTVEQALAARELIAAQALNQLSKMEHIAATDPEAVDPEILAEQIALAERAAVLNKRAMAKQKLAEQNSRSGPVKADPAAASNLAMVTPLEFVKVPGLDRPVMKPPTTSFVPVATSPGRKLLPGKSTRPRPGKSGVPAGDGPVPSSGRARVLARAEAAARAAAAPARPAPATPAPGADLQRRAAPVQLPAEPVSAPASADSVDAFVEPPRVAARSAYGLEPLDAATAGLGRAQRSRLLQLGVLALGIVALIAGVTLIISGLTR